MLRLGLVGLAAPHSRALVDENLVRNAEVVAVSDSSPALARAAAKRFGAKAVGTTKALLAQDVDAVVIGSPAGLVHRDVLACARAGAAVMTWLQGSLDELDACEAACEEADAPLMMVSPYRYFASVQRAFQILNQNLIGDLLAVRVLAHRPCAARDERAGALVDCAAPGVDLVRHLAFCEVTGVYAEIARGGAEAEDLAVLHLELEGDRFAGVTAARLRRGTHPRATDFEIEAICERGAVRVRPSEQAVYLVNAEDGRHESIPWGDAPFSDCVAAFAAAVAEESEMPVPITSARRTLAVIEAARKSAKTGGAVMI
jgi:predicted dehydrogenase